MQQKYFVRQFQGDAEIVRIESADGGTTFEEAKAKLAGILLENPERHRQRLECLPTFPESSVRRYERMGRNGNPIHFLSMFMVGPSHEPRS